MIDGLDALQAAAFARASIPTLSAFPPERRLAGGRLTDYLDSRAFAVIGSSRPDGRPHATMSSYVRRGDVFWLPTVGGSVRERNVRRQPWVTMTVTDSARSAHVVVLIEGPAEVVPLPEVPGDVRAAVPGDWVAAWIQLTPARLLSYADEAATV